MANTKMTKKDYFALIRTIVEATDREDKAEMLGFIDHEVELLSKKKSSTNKAEVKKAIEQVEKQLVPDGSSLEQELSNTELQWNKQITKQSREQLTEDVNSLIKDYIRSTARTLKSSKFNIQRIENLANTLVKTPSLQNIREQNHLTKYVQLYILKLVKNM